MFGPSGVRLDIRDRSESGVRLELRSLPFTGQTAWAECGDTTFVRNLDSGLFWSIN